MLMTFPTKESLIRNLNERDVSEVFLIIANFKSLAGWNLIPLRNITVLLGPNSSGKSTIYDAVEIVKSFRDGSYDADLWKGCRRIELEILRNSEEIIDGHEAPCVGFSMPFLPKKLDISGTHFNSLLIQASPFSGLNEWDNETDRNAFRTWFVLEGMNPGRYLHESLTQTRYTILGLGAGTLTDYEVYLNNQLASTQKYYEDDDEGNLSDVSVTIYPCANELLYYPSVVHGRSSSITAPPEDGLEGCFGWKGNAERTKRFTGSIKYSLAEGRAHSFYETLPIDIVGTVDATTNYGDKTAALSMAVALYRVSYHLFVEYMNGDKTDDIRDMDSDWHVSKYEPSSQHWIKSLSHLIGNEVRHKANMFAISDHERRDWEPRFLPILNRWLKEQAFLDSRYELRLDSSIELSIDVFDEYLLIKDEIWDDVREACLSPDFSRRDKGPVLEFRGRAYLVDSDGRELDFKSVGAGYSQTIPILIGLISKDTLFFKQPEVHLHPRLQSRVADCFVETIFSEKQRDEAKIRIVETHSEHFVLRLLRRLRESSYDELLHSSLTLYPEDVAFIYFQPQGTSTLVHHISVLPSGEFIEGWPDGFFDERDEDLWGMPSPRGR